jgi:hypothetical protein
VSESTKTAASTRDKYGEDLVVETIRLVRKICREKAVVDPNSLWKLADKEARELWANSGEPYHHHVLGIMRSFDEMSKYEFEAFKVLKALC